MSKEYSAVLDIFLFIFFFSKIIFTVEILFLYFKSCDISLYTCTFTELFG